MMSLFASWKRQPKVISMGFWQRLGRGISLLEVLPFEWRTRSTRVVLSMRRLKRSFAIGCDVIANLGFMLKVLKIFLFALPVVALQFQVTPSLALSPEAAESAFTETTAQTRSV